MKSSQESRRIRHDTTKTVDGVDSPTLVFQLHWVNAQTGEVFSKQIKRAKFLEHFVNKPSCLIGREARGGSKPKNNRQSWRSIG